MTPTENNTGGPVGRRALAPLVAVLVTLAALAALAFVGCGDDSNDAEGKTTTTAAANEKPNAERPAPKTAKERRKARAKKRRLAKLLHLEQTEVSWKRLGKGFVEEGIPVTVRVLRSGQLKAKVVAKAPTAKELELWNDPDKMKDRSVAKKKRKVKKGQRVTLLLKPHDEYVDNFRNAGRRVLAHAKYEIRAVLRDRKGRKVARKAKPIKVH